MIDESEDTLIGQTRKWNNGSGLPPFVVIERVDNIWGPTYNIRYIGENNVIAYKKSVIEEYTVALVDLDKEMANL